MVDTKPFRIVIATWGYAPIGQQTYGVFERKEEAMRIKGIAPGIIIPNDVGLGWPRAWRIVGAEVEEHDEGRGAIIANCEPVMEKQ